MPSLSAEQTPQVKPIKLISSLLPVHQTPAPEPRTLALDPLPIAKNQSPSSLVPQPYPFQPWTSPIPAPSPASPAPAPPSALPPAWPIPAALPRPAPPGPPSRTWNLARCCLNSFDRDSVRRWGSGPAGPGDTASLPCCLHIRECRILQGWG